MGHHRSSLYILSTYDTRVIVLYLLEIIDIVITSTFTLEQINKLYKRICDRASAITYMFLFSHLQVGCASRSSSKRKNMNAIECRSAYTRSHCCQM